MAQNIAAFHGGLIAVVQMQVRPTDSARRDLDDCITGMFDDWIGDCIDAYVAMSVPA